jgi:pimeloyl-ACP methyl ester carboxylesterase
VLLHGFGSGLAAWAPVLAPLAARFTVYALDLPGHGRSARPPFPVPAPTAAGDGEGRAGSGWRGAAGLWLDGPSLAPAYPAAVAADGAAAEEYFVGPLEGWRAEMCAQVRAYAKVPLEGGMQGGHCTAPTTHSFCFSRYRDLCHVS